MESLKNKLRLVSLGLGIFLTMLPGRALAATQENCVKEHTNFLNFPTWYKYLNPTFDSATNSCKLTFNTPQDIPKIVLALIEIMLRVGGLVAVIFVIIGGYKYLLSQGNPETAKEARGTIIAALIGMAIAGLATIIVNIIGRSV